MYFYNANFCFPKLNLTLLVKNKKAKLSSLEDEAFHFETDGHKKEP